MKKVEAICPEINDVDDEKDCITDEEQSEGSDDYDTDDNGDDDESDEGDEGDESDAENYLRKLEDEIDEPKVDADDEKENCENNGSNKLCKMGKRIINALRLVPKTKSDDDVNNNIINIYFLCETLFFV